MSARIRSPAVSTFRTAAALLAVALAGRVNAQTSDAFRKKTFVEPLPRSFSSQTGGIAMFRKVVTIVLIGASVSIAACNTVRGTARDLNSAANAVDNAT